jgi:hypothetical protein
MRDFLRKNSSYQYQRLKPVLFQLRTRLCHDETPHYPVDIQARNLQVLEQVSEAANGSAIDDATMMPPKTTMSRN